MAFPYPLSRHSRRCHPPQITRSTSENAGVVHYARGE